jgi:hypothetical protein
MDSREAANNKNEQLNKPRSRDRFPNHRRPCWCPPPLDAPPMPSTTSSAQKRWLPLLNVVQEGAWLYDGFFNFELLIFEN